MSVYSFACPVCVHESFLWVLGFLPTVKKHAGKQTDYDKLCLGVNERVNEYAHPLSLCPVFLASAPDPL